MRAKMCFESEFGIYPPPMDNRVRRTVPRVSAIIFHRFTTKTIEIYLPRRYGGKTSTKNALRSIDIIGNGAFCKALI